MPKILPALLLFVFSQVLVGQTTGLDIRLQGGTGLPGFENRSMGILGSVEMGYRYALSDHFVVRLAAGLQQENYRTTDAGVEKHYVGSCFWPFIIDFAGPDFFASNYYIRPLTAYVAPSMEVRRDRFTLSFSLQPGMVLNDRIAVQGVFKGPSGPAPESPISDQYELDEVVALTDGFYSALQLSYASRLRLDAGVGIAVELTDHISAGLRLRAPLVKGTLHDNFITRTTDDPSDPAFCEGVYARSESATTRSTIGVTLQYAFSGR